MNSKISFIFALLGFVVIANAVSLRDTEDSKWVQFKAEHKKSYLNSQEEVKRFLKLILRDFITLHVNLF